ncbi:hypothetical protein WDW89_05655 [Deltaproteobacteria bacterium TL4]
MMIIVLCIHLTLMSSEVEAHFESLIQYDLRSHWLPMLGDMDLANRYEATQTLLLFPQWSLPVLRESLTEPQYSSFHWRIAFLLGVLGDPQDIDLLLQNFIQTDPPFQRKVWIGALERIYWRYRVPASTRLLVTRLSFIATAERSTDEKSLENALIGILFYKIVNPDIQARLVRVQVDVWNAQLPQNFPLQYHWILSGRDIEAKVPLELHPREEANTVRIDFKVKEVGGTETLAYYHTEIPVLTPPAPRETPIEPPKLQ